jgi:hypothetical protein
MGKQRFGSGFGRQGLAPDPCFNKWPNRNVCCGKLREYCQNRRNPCHFNFFTMNQPIVENVSEKVCKEKLQKNLFLAGSGPDLDPEVLESLIKNRLIPQYCDLGSKV